MKIQMNTIIDSPGTDQYDLFWMFQLKHKEYSENLEKAACMQTRVVALFTNYAEDWIMCADGVEFSNWALL